MLPTITGQYGSFRHWYIFPIFIIKHMLDYLTGDHVMSREVEMKLQQNQYQTIVSRSQRPKASLVSNLGSLESIESKLVSQN